MFPSIDPVGTSAWSELSNYYQKNKDAQLTSFFERDSNRVKNFSTKLDDIFVDFSKNHIDSEIISLFKKLAEEVNLEAAKTAMFDGESINKTENRAVLHTALRNRSNAPVLVEGKDVMPDVNAVLKQIELFVNQLHNQEIVGYTGKAIKHVVNIGIGGSDLGPYMVLQALKPYWKGITPLFVSNVDASHWVETRNQIDPETTLFIIASKTFTTQETMTNANSARDWFLAHAKDESHISKHFVAVSTNEEKVIEFGINPENMFVFWDWVGGRYSLWSAIGLSIACTIGFENFESLLDGAFAADQHFKNAPFEQNIPTMMAFIGIWYNNFYNCETQAILPYDHLLNFFSRYLQQGDMESNGKYVSRSNQEVKHQTGQIIWGEPGTNGQHAFYQLIHQGTKLIHCDFIACAQPAHEYTDHQDKLIANFIAQTEALMVGKSESEVRSELSEKGMPEREIEALLPHKVFKGNRPTTSILLKKLTPKTLGSLIALYEHKIFVQGVIWNVYSFDQWGVELGKQLAGTVLKEIKSGNVSSAHDASTQNLIQKYLELNA